MKTALFRPLLALMLTAVVIFSGCKKDDPVDPPPSNTPRKALVITNGARTLDPDGSLTYTAQFVAEDGTISAATGVSWSSSNTAIATISAGGVAAAAGVGSVTITASVTESGTTYTATVPLGITAPSAFAVVPSAIIWEASGDMQLETVYFGTSAPTYTFSSTNSSIASVNSTGLVSFHSPGFCEILVTASTYPNNPFIVPVMVVGTPTVPLPVTRVEVSPGSADIFRQQTQQFTAQAFNTDGAVSRTLTWTSSDPSIATVDANGLVTGHSVGNAYIFATADGITGQAEIYVMPDTVIEVTPRLANITAGGSLQFTAKAYDLRNGGVLLPGITSFTWQVPSYGFPMFDFATVNSSGLVSVSSSAMPGNMTFVAASLPSNPEVAGVAIVMVSLCDCGAGNPDVASISVQNVNLSLVSNPSAQIVATARDAGGNVVANPELRYCADDASVVSVDELTGQVMAMGPGTTTIRVCSGGYATGTATVNVSF